MTDPNQPADEPKLAKNETIKSASNFLRGTIADGLLDDSTGALAADDTQLTKFHGIYQQDDRDLRGERRKAKQERAYAFMTRVRVPGGVRGFSRREAMAPSNFASRSVTAFSKASRSSRLSVRSLSSPWLNWEIMVPGLSSIAIGVSAATAEPIEMSGAAMADTGQLLP